MLKNDDQNYNSPLGQDYCIDTANKAAFQSMMTLFLQTMPSAYVLYVLMYVAFGDVIIAELFGVVRWRYESIRAYGRGCEPVSREDNVGFSHLTL